MIPRCSCNTIWDTLHSTRHHISTTALGSVWEDRWTTKNLNIPRNWEALEGKWRRGHDNHIPKKEGYRAVCQADTQLGAGQPAHYRLLTFHPAPSSQLERRWGAGAGHGQRHSMIWLQFGSKGSADRAVAVLRATFLLQSLPIRPSVHPCPQEPHARLQKHFPLFFQELQLSKYTLGRLKDFLLVLQE